jgi:diacylglycerol kinase family enzyme
VDQAIDIIIKGDIEKIDVGKVNGEYFFSNMGIGFDAKVIEVFEGTSKRQLIAYVKAILTSVFTYRYNNRLTIKMQGEEIGVNPFLFFVSNSNVMGYNFSLTKNASLIDGYLDVLIIKKINKLKVLLFGIFTMFGLSLSAEEVKYYKTKKLSLISHKSPGQSVLYQKDGELCRFDQNEISLSVSEKALHVIIKQDYRE